MFQKMLYQALLCGFVAVNSQLRWEVKSSPVIFGEDATLTCQELGNVCTQSRSWVGGKNYNLLCLDHNSTNPSKYQMISYKEKKTFDLVIKEFGDADVNCEYTCVCGFEQYTERLQLANMNYIYPPNMDIADASYQDQHNCGFHLNFTILKVYPAPRCSIEYSFEGHIVHTEKVQLTIDKLKEGMFHKADLLKEYDLSYNTTDKLSLTCIVGERNYEVHSWHVESCSDKPLGDSVSIVKHPYFIPLMIVAGTAIVCIPGIYILHKKRKAKNGGANSYTGTTNENLINNEDEEKDIKNMIITRNPI